MSESTTETNETGKYGPELADPDFHSGFVSLIGRPNSGKSTLLNQLAGFRLAITSPRPQTTRQIIRAIVDDEHSQIIFLDTPGLHKPRNRLGEYMMTVATQALADGDIILLLVDAEKSTQLYDGHLVPEIEQEILERAARDGKPVILLLNKVDLVVKESLLPLMAAYNQACRLAALIPVSAKTGDGLDILIREVLKLLPPGPRYYPANTMTDQTERALAAELIREQILFFTSEEIPHGTAVEIESFEELAGNEPAAAEKRERVRITASIYCDKESHKGILIGHQGAMLKRIGSAARVHIEKMLDCPCYLDLHVKVREGWRNRVGVLRNLGFEIDEQKKWHR
jgi:GTPase